MREEDVERILRALRDRVVSDVAAHAFTSDSTTLDDVVADSIYHERERVEGGGPRGKRRANERWWSALHESLLRAGSDPRALVARIVDHYADEISGSFDQRVYDVVTRVGEPVAALLLNAMSPKRILQSLPDLPRLDETIHLQGETEQLRRLHELGTVLLVPTHVSHMDSIAVGYALWKLGLPPFLYGAGRDLFDNPMLGFFMRNLGAYTVDRSKTDPLYQRVLKEYATLTLESGFDNIFFPGGARARSGAVERKLELGLLGTGIAAYVHNLRAARPGGRIFIVPATLSFQLVLEAETLIDDFLKEVGKARYIITDDEFSKPRRVVEFVSQLFSLDSKIYFTVGRGLDPFGNVVDDEGESLDASGRFVDASRYVMRDGVVVHDAQRDAELTRELGCSIVETWARDSVLQSTHVTAAAMLALLRRENPGVDLLRLVRAGGRVEDVELRALYREVDRVLTALRALAGRGAVRLGPTLANGAADDVTADGLRHFATYHRRRAVERRGDRVTAPDRALLFYYSNRLEPYDLGRAVGLAPALTPDHRALARSAGAAA